MTIRFVKSRHADRPHTITCVRDDGTTVGQRSTDFFVHHDLTHYAIETTLGLTDAFWGLLNQGWEFSSFEEREPGTRKARVLPPEAYLAEVLAGSYDLEVAAGPQPDEDRAIALAGLGLSIPSPTTEQFQRIRSRRAELHQRWRDLDQGAWLELEFPL